MVEDRTAAAAGGAGGQAREREGPRGLQQAPRAAGLERAAGDAEAAFVDGREDQLAGHREALERGEAAAGRVLARSARGGEREPGHRGAARAGRADEDRRQEPAAAVP